MAKIEKRKGKAASYKPKESPSAVRERVVKEHLAKGEKPVGVVKTKGGDYPVYRKSSESAKSFRSAFRAARGAKKKVFTWRGRKYTTKLKGE